MKNETPKKLYKRCWKCKVVKSIHDFYTNNFEKDKHQWACKDCQTGDIKICPRCDKRHKLVDGLCKPCRKQIAYAAGLKLKDD